MELIDPDRIRLATDSWESALEIVQQGLNPERSFIVTGPSHGPRALKGLDPCEIPKGLKLVSESLPAGLPVYRPGIMERCGCPTHQARKPGLCSGSVSGDSDSANPLAQLTRFLANTVAAL